ncbi:MAG: 3-hydroxyacyl-CoA dehydrogenase family protein [Lachnospiraceae bacterium]|jgi:carnitine 3-dehydrogenase
MKNEKVAFIGSGMIGSGLAVNAMMHGYKTYLQTRKQVEKMKNRVIHIFEIMVENEICTQAEADKYAKNAVYTTSIEEAVADAIFIQESGPENLEIKKQLIQKIAGFCPKDSIIASSTSKLLPSDLQEGCRNPERVIVGHPYHPSYLLPLIEICGGNQTTEEYIQKAKSHYESMGKIAIICRKEASGYIVNRASWAVNEEARKTVLEGFCSVEEMDKAIMYGPGLRMAVTGQLMTIALGVEGGARAQAAKYGREPSPEDEIIAQGIEEAMANRPVVIGNDEASIGDFRDKVIVEVLRMQGLL